MADTIKIIIILVSISVLLFSTQIMDGDVLFGKKVFDRWLTQNEAEEYYNTSSEYGSSASRFDNPSSTGASTGVTGFNFLDVTFIVWGFVVMIFNIVIAIPLALLGLFGLPYMFKLVIIVPLIIISTAVLVISGVFGRR